MNHYYGQREKVSRIYNSIKNFVGNNEVFKAGDVLYVSTKNDDHFDLVIFADGVHTFCELLQSKKEESYKAVKHVADLAKNGGKDIVVTSDDVADAFTSSLPYFKNIVVRDVEVSQSVTMKATEKITLDGVSISGGKGETNGKIIYAADELNLKNISAQDGTTLYNAFEGAQAVDANYNGLKKLVAEDIDIDCPSITHNIINVYTPADNAVITVRNSKFNLTVDNSNVLRLANYLNAENVTVQFENVEWNYEEGLTKNDWRWAGLVIFQPSNSDVALQGDLSKLKTWKFRFKNCKYNGQQITENGFGTHSQVFYLYNVGNTRQVTDPVEAGINVTIG